MTNKTSELFDAFDLSDLRFFLLIAKKKFKILNIYLVFIVNICLIHFTKYGKKVSQRGYYCN